ncbi:hypothetical protein DCCM_2589 [Desulfocucumis palustris]|uniref:Uncharacterized protein n=1 Tax=Desulfocucumis palustris TaxID=1898651 RepID=A0A2L2XB22_9FIRM|nr:hypothetical protein DCCM_2589 [Desulfocucumis palustris]
MWEYSYYIHNTAQTSKIRHNTINPLLSFSKIAPKMLERGDIESYQEPENKNSTGHRHILTGAPKYPGD